MSRRRSLRAHSTSFNSCLPAILFCLSERQPPLPQRHVFPLKNGPFTLSGDAAFASRSMVFSLPRTPLIFPLTDHNSHWKCSPCVCGFVRRYLRSPSRIILALTLVLLPDSYPAPLAMAALMWHHSVLYLPRRPWWDWTHNTAVWQWLLSDISGMEADTNLEEWVTDGNMRYKGAVRWSAVGLVLRIEEN